MVKIQSLLIKDFKSIANAELKYEAGVWLVQGVNNDAVFKSNGAGKTTMMEALQQCLFNKTQSPTPIEDTSRKIDGVTNHTRKYYLELTFEKDNNTYQIINDRQQMIIKVIKNGKDLMFKSIPASLKAIQSIIGMDFQTFVTLTFINHDTIVDLLDNFSSSALMKIILNFSQIANFEKRSKIEQKVLNTNITALNTVIQTINESLSILDQFKEVDIGPIVKDQILIKQKISKLENTQGAMITKLINDLENSRDDLYDLNDKMNNIEAKLDSSVCEACGTRLDLSEAEEKDLEIELAGFEMVNKQRQLMITKDEENLSELSETYDLAYNTYNKELLEIGQQLVAAKTRNQLYNDSKTQADDMRKKLQDSITEHDELTFKLSVIQTALLVLKSGDIQKDLLNTFVGVLNVHLKHFIKFVSLTYIGITAEASKANVAFNVYDNRFSHNISIHTLSGGEKTRLRLVVLLAMLSTIKELANISSNILVFDESLDTLDDSAAVDLANLFDYLVHHDDKFIAMISHGAQLDKIEFTGTLLATKTDSVTTVSKEYT